MAEKRRRLQASILELLAANPRTLDALLHALPDYRRDNVVRAASALVHRGLVELRDQAPAEGDWHFSGPAILSLPARLPPEPEPPQERGASKHVGYAALARAFLLLSAGNPVTMDELFPPRSATRKFAQRALETLQALNLIETTDSVRYTIKDTKAFKATWADELLFCAALGRECSREQAESMHVLLSGGSLRAEAAAAAFLYNVIGQENTARRTGLPTSTVTALRRIAALAPEAQEAIEASGLGARWILGCPPETTAAEIIAALTPPGAQEAPAETEAGHAELLATCLKLCAFTADTVAKMERRLAFLAKELGYQGE